MGSIGNLLIVLGLGSFLLNWFGYEFKLLIWIDHWGTGVGDILRISFIVVGMVLMLFARRDVDAVE